MVTFCGEWSCVLALPYVLRLQPILTLAAAQTQASAPRWVLRWARRLIYGEGGGGGGEGESGGGGESFVGAPIANHNRKLNNKQYVTILYPM